MLNKINHYYCGDHSNTKQISCRSVHWLVNPSIHLLGVQVRGGSILNKEAQASQSLATFTCSFGESLSLGSSQGLLPVIPTRDTYVQEVS